MKHITVLAFLVLLGGCSSTTVYKTTLTGTSNASENVRSEDVAFCMRTAYTEHLLLGLNTSTYQGWFVK